MPLLPKARQKIRGQALILTSANFVKILIFVVIPLLVIAAYIEANITPQIVLAFYAGR